MKFTKSLRFRLALTYSVAVFVLGALIVGTINFVLDRSLTERPAVQDIQVRRVGTEPGAAVFLDGDVLEAIEALGNARALEQLRSMSLIMLLVLFPASVVTGWFVSGRMLRPVDRIARVAMDIQASDLSRRIRLEGPDDELKHLADAFDAMLDRIEEGAEDQRRFIQDVSHELRNPLATIATTLDLALSSPDADLATLRETAETVRRSIDRTSLTVDGLARFARRELPAMGGFTFPVGNVVDEVLAEVAAAAARRHLRLERVGDAGPLLRGDRQSLRSALANLVGNAVRMAPEGSTVRCGCGAVGDWAWAGVADEGPGIPDGDHRLVFQRDWTRDRSRLHHERRAGLGLSIVRQVAEAVGGTVTLTSDPASGSSFVIWLPMRRGGDPSSLTWDGIHPVHDPLAGAPPEAAREVV